MSGKYYISAQSLLDDAFRLGAMVEQSGFVPTFILALWRGGVPIGIAVQEYLAYRGLRADHIAIRTASYSGVDKREPEVQIYGINYLLKSMGHTDRLLIVDDVFDTGHTIKALIAHLNQAARKNAPAEIRIAVPYYKPNRNQTDRVPDYYLHETDAWIKFPHSLEGLTAEEVEQNRPELFEILKPALNGNASEG